jgi:hypothetical protein
MYEASSSPLSDVIARVPSHPNPARATVAPNGSVIVPSVASERVSVIVLWSGA